MEIKIGKKEYNLKDVSIYISDLYIDYVRERNEALTLEADFEGARLECELAMEEAENKADKLRAQLKMFKDARELKKSALDDAQKAAKKRNEIIKEIVELNGYDYDESVWIKGISEDQFSDIIEDLIGGKKKATQPLT